MIKVRTLGTAEVLVGERRIAPDSAMLFALALFLSVSAGQRVRRSRLLDLFWPDASDHSRRHALRQLLYRLRRDGFSLAVDGEELFVACDAVESDLRPVLASQWPEQASEMEVQAAARVLPGYEPPMPELFRQWLDELRSRVDSQYRRALLRQIDAARRDGRWHDVDEWARRCLEADPLNEEATLAHAEALAMRGSKAHALQIIDDYLRDLGDRGRKIGLPARIMRTRVSENAPARLRDEQESVPLVGREAEVAQLLDALSGTLSGQGRALFIEGAAGIGKSRLAQELIATAAMRGWKTVCTRRQASDGQRPLGVFVDLFGALLQLPGALGCSPASLSQLRLLTNHEVTVDAEARRSQEAEAVQDRLRRAAEDLLDSVVSESPLVVMIDDLHWCDTASAHLLQHLISRSANIPVMWAFTARHEGLYASLRDSMADLRVGTMRVAPLSPANAGTLFRVLAHGTESEGADDELRVTNAVTGGNPLFVLELARHVRETGQSSSLPPSLRALIRDRAARLSPLAQHVLHACAVLGRYASVPRVAATLELRTADLLACIDELDALGIVGTDHVAEALSIHDLWREELLATLLPASRKLLHHRCGVVLERECRLSRSPAVVWEAAQHLLASGSEGRGLSLLQECAQHQLDNGLPQEAAATFHLAFLASNTDGDRLRSLRGRLSALKCASDWIELSSVVGTAIELDARSSMFPTRHSDLELLQIEAMWRTESDLRRSLERSLSCALDEFAPAEHRAHAALLSAIVADNICRFSDLRQLNDISSALVVSAPGARASILAVQLIFETVLGSLDTARARGAILVDLEKGAGSVRGLARALRFSSLAHRMLGEFAEALSAVGQALELAEQHQLIGEAASAADTILSIHLEREDLAAAELWISKSAELAPRVGARYARVSLAINRAIFAVLRRDYDGAMTHIGPYSEDHLSDPAIRQRMLCLSVLTRIAVSRAERSRVCELAPALEAALAVRRSTGPHDFHVASYAHALRAIGETRAASEYVRDFVTLARRDRTPLSIELQDLLRA